MTAPVSAPVVPAAPKPKKKFTINPSKVAQDVVIVLVGVEGVLQTATGVASGLKLPQVDMAAIAVASALVVKAVATIRDLIAAKVIPTT